MKLIGICDGTYTSKKDGRKVAGYRMYFTEQRDSVIGLRCEEVWVRENIGNDFLANFPGTDQAIGVECQVFYDRFRSVQAVLPVSVASRK